MGSKSNSSEIQKAFLFFVSGNLKTLCINDTVYFLFLPLALPDLETLVVKLSTLLTVCMD